MIESNQAKKRPSLGGKLEDFVISLPCEESNNVSSLEENTKYNGVIQRLFTGGNSTGKYLGIETLLNDKKTVFTTFQTLPIPKFSPLLILLMSMTEEREIKSSDLPALLIDLPIMFTVRNRLKDDGKLISYFKTIKADEDFEEAEENNLGKSSVDFPM